MKMDEQGKQRYLEKWTSNFHHLLIQILVWINFQNSDCDFWNDEICFMTVQPRFMCVELVYIGYITQNYIDLKYLVGDKDQTTQLVLWHHIIVIPGLLFGLYAGFAVPLTTNIACACEISAIFMNYRSMWTKEETNEQVVPMVN